MKRILSAIGVAIFLCATSVQAQLAEPLPTKLTLTPAKPSTPALKYQLLPNASVLTSGDAAPLYKQVIDRFQKSSFNQNTRRFASWINLPLDKLPKDEMRKALAEYDDIFQLLEKAARCDHCDWGIIQQLREKGNIKELPRPFQLLGPCATLLVLRIRLELADGHMDIASATLRIGFACTRHCGTTGTMAQQLSVHRFASALHRQLDEIVARPDAPNLYFALTDLPAPFSPRQAMEAERLLTYRAFPGLYNVATHLDAGNMEAKQLEECVLIIVNYGKGVPEGTALEANFEERQRLGKAIQNKHEIAKKALIEAGRPRDKVEAMPHLQVALLHALLECDAALDEMTVWTNLSYGEMTEHFSQMKKRFSEEREKDSSAPAIGLVPSILTWIDAGASASARTDRKVALLRIIEAIRYYAATHEGELPQSLEAIKEVPIPFDPLTSKAFEYQVNGDAATLRAPPPRKEMASIANTMAYELRIRH